MIRIAICDDQKEHVEYLTQMIKEELKERCYIQVFQNSFDLINYLNKDAFGFDAIFLEIILDNQNGIQVGKTIKENFPLTCLVYVSGYTEYSQDIFETDPTCFLIKPVVQNRLKKAIEILIQKIESIKEKAIYLKVDKEFVRIVANNIHFIESSGHTIQIHTANKRYKIYLKMDEMSKMLPNYFLRCHKSYIINMNFIKLFSIDKILLNSGMEIPISQSKKSDVKTHFYAFAMNDL